MSKHVPRDTEVQTPKRAVLPPEMIEVALPNRIEPLAGSLDLPEGPTVAGHADRVLIALVGAVAMEPEAVSMLPSGRMLA